MRPLRTIAILLVLALAAIMAGCASAPGVGAYVRAPYKSGGAFMDQARAADACFRLIAAGEMTEQAAESCMAKRGWPYVPQYWYKSAGSEALFTVDSQACMAAPAPESMSQFTPAVVLGFSLRRCLEDRGWALLPGKP